MIEEHENENEAREKDIMEKVRDIANSIHKSISVKVDYPSNHTNKRLPILDTEMWIEEIGVNGTMRHQILYSYYEKDMSSKYLIHKNSALSNQSKINILVNDLVRVMKNTSLRVNGEEKRTNIQHYMNKMQFSGYEKDERIKVYKRAKKIFEGRIEKSEVYPHKNKFSKIKEQTREKLQQKKAWYAKRKYKSVFYVDTTPNNHLAKQCQQILDKCEVPIKVMEKTGESIKKLLVKSNPFKDKDKNCNDQRCAVCLSDSKINCRARDVVYENYCEHHLTCQGKYDGETAHPIKERFKEHLDDYRLRPQTSAMHEHSVEKHDGQKVNFKVKILGVCPGDALLRQCMEAVSIRDTKPIMNGREEWGTTNNKQHQTNKPNTLKKTKDTVIPNANVNENTMTSL